MSSLLTVLTVTGLLCCLLLVSHAQDDVDCDAEVAKCPGLNRVLSPDDLDNLCSTQDDRKTCYAALPDECLTDAYTNSLDAVDYICQQEIVDALKPELTNCVMPNQQTIDDSYNDCAAKVPAFMTGSCMLDMDRKCAIEAYNNCCPSMCQYLDVYVYMFYKTFPTTRMCPWHKVSGYCNSPRKACATPEQ